MTYFYRHICRDGMIPGSIVASETVEDRHNMSAGGRCTQVYWDTEVGREVQAAL